MNIAIIFAGGKGTRMGADIPKQFLELDGETILANTIRRFNNNKNIDKIYISTVKEYISFVKKLIQDCKFEKVVSVIEGGETALDSQYRALEKASCKEEQNPDDSIVLMHDGVRPFISDEIIDKVINGVIENGNSITCVPATETVFISRDGKSIEEVPPRQNCYLAKAPQGYRLSELMECFKKAKLEKEGYGDCTDSCSLMRKYGKRINYVLDSEHNIKITKPIHYEIATAINNWLKKVQDLGVLPSKYNPFKKNKGNE